MGKKLGKAEIPENMRVYAVGDIHGCIDELNDMLRLIKQHLKANPVKHHRIIFLGDYVDRGPDSKGVIKKLIRLSASNSDVTCLIGNHDEKLLRAMKPMQRDEFDRYLKYGGGETLETFGFPRKKLKQFRKGPHTDEMAQKFARQVRKLIPEEYTNFLKNLETSTSEGDYFFCHAGVRPDVKLSKQKGKDLIWIREPFLSWKKPLRKVIIHGHTRQAEVQERTNRINIDTSCCYGGELTAIILEGASRSYLTVPARRKYWE